MKNILAVLGLICCFGCATPYDPSKFSEVPDEWMTPWTPTVPKTNVVKRAIAAVPPVPRVSTNFSQAARAHALPPFTSAGIAAPATRLLSAAAPGATPSVTLAWDASPDPSVTGYRIYFGVKSVMYTNSAAVGNVLTATLTNLNPATTYYFAATAYDASGTESPFSNEASYTTSTPVVTYYALTRAETVFYWLWPGPAGTLQRSTNLVPVTITVTNISGNVTNRITQVATNWYDVGPINTNQKVSQTNSLAAEFYRVKVTQ